MTPRMSEAGFYISPFERELMRRLTAILAFLFITAGAFWRLELMYSQKFFDQTGRAEWIWGRREITRGTALAFYATRDFDLPPNRYYTHIKIAGDPEYTLIFNGVTIGGRRMSDENRHLDVYDVTALAKTKANRIVVALRSTNGVGGLLASIDIAPENRNVVITDGSWHIVPAYSADLPVRDVVSAAPPVLFGRPPIGKWNYLQAEDAAPFPPVQRVRTAVNVTEFKSAIPEIATPGGVAVVKARPMRATAFDFGGPCDGRVRLELNHDPGSSEFVYVRFANVANELMAIDNNMEAFVFAPHERVVIDTSRRLFRYVAVYGATSSVQASVLE
jgi:hypothetical protein